jgi:hypothetical protein
MSDVATIITAAGGFVTALVPLGGGIKWLSARNDRRFKSIEDKLAACERREKTHNETTSKQLIVIELLWQAASKSKAAAPVLARCKEHLDDLKERARKEPAHD